MTPPATQVCRRLFPNSLCSTRIAEGRGITLTTPSKVIRVEVERDHATHYGALDRLQTVAARDAEDCQRARPKVRDGSLQCVAEKLGLANGWQRHVRLVVGNRNFKPRMTHDTRASKVAAQARRA